MAMYKKVQLPRSERRRDQAPQTVLTQGPWEHMGGGEQIFHNCPSIPKEGRLSSEELFHSARSKHTIYSPSMVGARFEVLTCSVF